ncbi:dnaJ homolog [Olea europaea subsp. europaea]|uniref:DnaJ homolog n=1 Tax=Olea europaea subsp. europaea TaxID=158383 RepID=A0A8S0VF04_OLEEU|nr:dnaJ homolog [Olea europaea subsp. europaea]
MINTVRMLSRKEWGVEVAVATTRLTSLNLFLVVVLSVVLAEAAEAEGKEGEKMLFNLSRFHLRISIMVHRRNFPFLVMCSAPSARGSKSGASMKCRGCQGSGMKVSVRHLGPSMIQQMQHPCNECKGTGETISDRDRCPQCKGEKVVQEKKVLEVHVEKGMQNGQRVTFPGEADEAPDTVTGDIVFVVQQKEHPKFKRKGDDLFVEHALTLTEALCGFQFILTHLDSRQLLIKSQPGEVVKPDQFKAINDEGMPMYQRPFMKGKLYIHFTVDFPEFLHPEQCKAIETVLPARAATQIRDMELDECEETTLHDVNIEEEMRRKQQAAQEAYEEDDDDMHGGAQRVQCAQQ